MSVSIGAFSQTNNYYRPQNVNTAAAQNTTAANPSIAVGKTENSSQSGKIMDRKDPNYACQTCKSRKYQDQSDDPSVSFKTPTNISPSASASAVMSHEQEHVSNEKAEARAEERRVVSQSVVLYYAVCPECHKTYVSGGKTTTVTAENKNARESDQKQLDIRI